jgi:hypothetical protein
MNTLCGQNAQILNIKVGGTYSYHYALNDSFGKCSEEEVMLIGIIVALLPAEKGKCYKWTKNLLHRVIQSHIDLLNYLVFSTM